MAAMIPSNESFPDPNHSAAASNEAVGNQSNLTMDSCNGDRDVRTNYIAFVKELKKVLQAYMLDDSENFEAERYFSEYRMSRRSKISKWYEHLKEDEWSLTDKDSFTCFTGLPIELRRHIWFHALPGPRVLTLFVDKREEKLENLTTGWAPAALHIRLENNHHQCGDSTRLRMVCRESYELFAEHYKYITLSRKPSEKFVTLDPSELMGGTRFQSHHFINFEVDTLVVHDFEGKYEELGQFGLQLNLSSLRKLTITGFWYELGSIPSPSMWKTIEQACPLLKYLKVVINERYFPHSSHTIHLNSCEDADGISKSTKNKIVSSVAKLTKNGYFRKIHERAVISKQDLSISVQSSYAEQVELDIYELMLFPCRREQGDRRLCVLDVNIRKDSLVLYLKDDIITIGLNGHLTLPDGYECIKESLK